MPLDLTARSVGWKVVVSERSGNIYHGCVPECDYLYMVNGSMAEQEIWAWSNSPFQEILAPSTPYLRTVSPPASFLRFRSPRTASISVHVIALDSLVNVNSFFTMAVFVGLFLTMPNQYSLENRAVYDAGIDTARRLRVFEVVSSSFFLFSSLIAQGLKLVINLLNSKDVDETFRVHINLTALRLGMLRSAVG